MIARRGFSHPWRISGVAVANEIVYETERWSYGNVIQTGADAGTSTLVPASSLYNQPPSRIVTDGSRLFWSEDPTGSGSVEGCAFDGTGLVRYVSSAQSIVLAVDGTHLYDGSGYSGQADFTVVRFDAGDPSSAQTLYYHLPYSSASLAVDATSLYWGDYSNGVIYKAPK